MPSGSSSREHCSQQAVWPQAEIGTHLLQRCEIPLSEGPVQPGVVRVVAHPLWQLQGSCVWMPCLCYPLHKVQPLEVLEREKQT
jgi:hypothetical protein